MVTGNEFVFDDVEQARDYILLLEKEKLGSEEQRQKPLEVCDGAFNPIAKDSLDYPFSAFFNDAPSDAFIMTRLGSGRYSLKPNLRDNYYLYRGESGFHNPCKPNLFRNKHQKRFVAESVKFQELMFLMLSHPLVQLLDLGVEINGKVYRFEMNLYGLCQHYYNKTALLDLTSSIDVATFFATTKYDEESDTYSPILDQAHSEGVLYYYTLDITKDFKIIPLSTIGLQVFPRSEAQRGFLLAFTKEENFNDNARLNAFRFKHAPIVAQRIFDKYKGGELLFPKDILTEHWHHFNKKSNTISRRTLLLNKKMNKDSSLQELKEEIESLDIKIADYIPAFTPKELEKYYASVANEDFWEKFCDKIFIPGDDGTMKQALKNVRFDNRYRWAFEPGISHTINYNDGYLLRMYQECLR